MTTFPASDASRTTSRERAVTRGEPRIRSDDQAPVPVSPAYAGLPDRDTGSSCPTSRGSRRVRSPSSRLAALLGTGIEVHGSLDRAKDVSSTMEALPRRRPGRVHALEVRYADDVPLLGDQRTPAVVGAAACPGTSPLQTKRTDLDPRSSASPRRLAAPDGSGCLSPSRRRAWEEALPSFHDPASASRSRRPHVLPMAGDNRASRALQASLPGKPGRISREQVAFVSSLDAAPGPDDPSTPAWLGLRGLSQRADCSRCTYADRSASTASTTESPRPDVPRTS
jgi:hypothetical protein